MTLLFNVLVALFLNRLVHGFGIDGIRGLALSVCLYVFYRVLYLLIWGEKK